jgi:hypothetical protein
MSKYSLAKPLGSALRCAFVLAVFATAPARAADPCPTSVDEIATDRPDVTNSSLVVPYGNLQAENGVDWAVMNGSNLLTGTNTRIRLGIAHCTEFLVDVPNYFLPIDGSQPSGFSDVVVSFKRQLPVPFGFVLSATAGLGFSSGHREISGRGYEPYIQFPWSHKIGDNWEAAGMFTVTWFPSESPRNPTFEPTLSLERAFRRHVRRICWRLRPSKTEPGAGYRRGLAIHENTADRFFTLASDSAAAQWITISASGIQSVWTGYLEDWLEVHHNLSPLDTLSGVRRRTRRVGDSVRPGEKRAQDEKPCGAILNAFANLLAKV